MSEPTLQQTQARMLSYTLLPVQSIDDNHIHNCRGKITTLDVSFLAEDISKNGLMQPIIVRPMVNGTFTHRVVAGFSRMMALRVLRWKEIPCIIRDCDDETAAFLNLAENLTRKDLNFMQEAEAVRKLGLQYPHLNDEKIGERLGQSAGWVKVRLYALNMPEEVKDYIARGYCTYDHILKMHRMSHREQLEAIRKIKEARERGLKACLYEKKRVFKPKEPRKRSEMFAMQEHIVKALGTNNFGTRCLAWAAGEINDGELFGDIAHLAELDNIPYTRPTELDMRSMIQKWREDSV